MLRGAGDKFFSAGADINMLRRNRTSFAITLRFTAMRRCLAWRTRRSSSSPPSTVTAWAAASRSQWHATFGSPRKNAGRTGLAEVNLGVIPGMGGTQRLPRLVGKARAIELAATGRMIAFEEALEFGLINEIFEGEDFFDQVVDYARQFVAPNKPSKAVGLIKRAIQTRIARQPMGRSGVRTRTARTGVCDQRCGRGPERIQREARGQV